MDDLNSITRFNKFFDFNDLKYHENIAKEYIEDFTSVKLYLRKFDRKNTQIDDLYNEVISTVVLLPEIEIIVSDFELKEGEQKQYDTNNANINYQNYGNMEFSVQKSFLDERNLTINIGDIIIFYPNPETPAYFEIITDDRTDASSQGLLLGIKPSYKRFKAINIDNSKLGLS